jgi:hypothetical protein
VAKHIKASSILVFSFAEASRTNKISGMYSHIASASANSTSLKLSRSHLLPRKKKKTTYIHMYEETMVEFLS